MTRSKLRILAGALLGLSLSPAASAPPPQTGWTAAESDIPPDPAVRFGRLPNGMRYAIMRNATPKGEASLRLRIAAGSLHEADDQRGLAHFLEHMVLNGTRHVPEGEFVRRLEREGLKFGPDTNATTSFEQTVYMLDLPQANAQKLETALFLLREVADEATLDPAAIDRERGIVLSEERTRASPGYRILVDELGYLYRGDRLPARLPIGDTQVVQTAPRARFAAFYEAYYRPERATLVAVGDFDPAQMEAKIRAGFSGWKGTGQPGAEPAAPVVQTRGPESRVLVERGGSNRVSIAWVTPPDLRPDTEATRRSNLVDRLALTILNRRLELLATTASPPYIGAGASIGQQADRAQVVQLGAVAQPGKWREALAAIEQEGRRAATHGVTAQELAREVTEIRARLLASVAATDTRSTPALANALVSAANERQVFTAPATSLALFDRATGTITSAEVSQALRRLLSGNGPLLYLTSSVPLDKGEAALTAAFVQSTAVPVTPPRVRTVKAWPYETFGKPGQVVERRSMEGLGATALRFANGVRLTVKPTQFRKDQVLVSVRYGRGLLDLPRGRASPLWAANGGAFSSGGLGKLTAEEMKQVLAGTVWSASQGQDDDSFALSGGTRTEDIARQMQILAAYMVDPGWRPNAFQRLRALASTFHEQLEATPGGVFSRDAAMLLRSGDLRWATPTRAEMEAGTVADARAVLDPILANGPVEVVVVGDITVEEAVKQTAATFGALSPRSSPALDPAATTLHFPAAETVVRTHKGRPDQGFAFIAWPTTDFYSDTKRARRLNLLGQVLQLRLTDEIREKQGTTYSPSAGHSPSDTFPGYGYLSAAIEAPPEKLDGFFADALRIAADLAANPASPDELERARRPLVDNLERQRLGNAWWLSQLGGLAEHPERQSAILDAVDQYRAVTPAELQAIARTFLTQERAWRFKAVPEAKP